jgi:hypothetical protein
MLSIFRRVLTVEELTEATCVHEELEESPELDVLDPLCKIPDLLSDGPKISKNTC